VAAFSGITGPRFSAQEVTGAVSLALQPFIQVIITTKRRGATIAVAPRLIRLLYIDRTVGHFSFQYRAAVIVALTVIDFRLTFSVLDRMRTCAGNGMCRRNPAKYGYSDKCQQNKGFFHLNGFLGVELKGLSFSRYSFFGI
jgi:hypothetical protein